MTARYQALVAGATGATSKRLVDLLAGDPDWDVIGIARNPPVGHGTSVRYMSADLTDANALREISSAFTDVTHLFYCCRAPHGETGVESVADNVRMLTDVLDAVDTRARGLQHVHLVEGGKWYGMHLGAFPTPAYEDDPRHLPPNFYYDQEDYLRARQAGERWTWSASRPNFITDFAPERPRNLVAVLGAWAAICRACGMALDYPGQPGAFTALAELTDATQLARAMRFMAITPACANQAFNVTNGEPYRWQRFWPRLADLYELETGPIRPLRLGTWMADKEPLWQQLVAEHNLIDQPMSDVVLWDFADFALNQNHDVFYSMTKLRNAGFRDSVDTHATLLAQIQAYRDARVFP
ncbi:MAG: SDR family oxidoreductase [Pseudomonadota bacterium]